MKRIACMGDWGYEELPAFIYDALKKVDCLFLLGDNFYPSGVTSVDDEQWEKKLKNFFPMEKRKYVVLGNHDYLGDVYAQILYSFSKTYFSWYFPHFYYDEVDRENDAHYFFIDTALLSPQYTLHLLHACNIDPHYLQIYYFLLDHFAVRQREWIEQKVKQSDSKWKMIMGHYPVVSGGKHQISEEVYGFIKYLCETNSIDYYISGHEHNIQYLQKFNTHFIVTGGLSHNYPVETIAETHFCSFDAGFVELEVHKEKVLSYVVQEHGKFLLHVNYK